MANLDMDERRYLAISIKHTEHGWKFGKPCVLWGWKMTKDDEKRCFAGYTRDPNKAELYSLQDWLDSGYGSITIKMDEPVHMEVHLCKKWQMYDTVLIDKDEYIGYCMMNGYPIDTPKPNNSLKRTNGDKIRSMTDEELAAHFNQMEKDVSDHMNAGGRWNIGESNIAFWIKWLGTPEGEDCE